MNAMKLALGLGLAAVVSACGASDVVTRDAPFVSRTNIAAEPIAPQNVAGTELQLLPAAIMQKVTVDRINVTVPASLSVSEANRYYPGSDIVWREDPIGDRHAQVARIVEDALRSGTQSFQGPVPVTLDVEVARFHAVTEKARYTVGGTHSIIFTMQLRDSQTGAPLTEPKKIHADLDAFGGQQAILAEARGQTQKVRISNHLAEVIRQELLQPGGYENARLGFFQLVNKI
ncbi:DUF6778 family protein [uncultured Sulfitobacter sp.]|uniref:DUF6778 family protein n=1 Tax=uncultured Sulfitobacter sp. TaxID=191468 RepID=UPI00260F2C8F|nr:DUF6778 family protein [uncultured Sulfitobacter sp.]